MFIITAFAPVLGWLIRREALSTPQAYVVAFVVCIGSVVAGFWWPVSVAGETWRYLLTAYVFLACALPLWFILQPRDFTNVQLVDGGQALLVLSVIVAGSLAGGCRRRQPTSRAAPL